MIFKLHWFGDRQQIWQAKAKLKGTSFFIKEDFPKEINERRKPLFPIMYAARNLGFNAYVVFDKLHISKADFHQVFDADSLDKLPREIDPKYVSTKVTENEFAFFGRLCPLSNFHDSNFQLDNMTFRWVEQYFTYKKVEYAHDEPAMKRILNANTPAECKSIARSVKVDFKSWNRQEGSVMARALRAKYMQNPDLKEYLLKTGKRTIAESSPTDKYWGTGIGLAQENATKQQHWTGQNNLGLLLMKLRDDLSE